MNQYIVYTSEEGSVVVLLPSPDCGLTLEEIAAKDVPQDVPYKIVTAEDLPSDRLFRDAWEVEVSEPDGYGIGPVAWFAERGITI